MTTMTATFAALGFVARAKGARRPQVTLDYATAVVVGEAHLFGNSYDPRGHGYQLLTVLGRDAKGRTLKLAACRRGANYAISPLDQFAPIAI